MPLRLQLQFGDLTSLGVECIVNSTDMSLLEGGPVHKAVHEAAGPGLEAECGDLGPCPVGEVRLSRGHGLQAAWVIHTVAPTWHGGDQGEADLLAACYRNALEAAAAKGIRSMAFPSIGSGLQPQIPLEVAAPVALKTIYDFLEGHPLPEKVALVCFDAPTFQIHQRTLKEILP